VVEIKYSKEKTPSQMIEKALKQIKEKKYYEKYGDREIRLLLAIAVGDKKEIEYRFQ
jgi:hypothetical protein